MIKHRISMRKIYAGIFALSLIWTSTTLAQKNNIVWLQFEKASKLFQQSAPSKQVVELLKDVQRNTQDPLLFSRAGLLLSATHQREEQNEKAVLELQRLINSSQSIPKSVLEETWLRIGQLYVEQQRFQLAITAFNKIINGDSNPFIAQEAQLALAWIAAEQDDWNTSDSLINSLAFNDTSHLTDERILILKARGVISRGKPDEAIILLQNTRSKACLYLLAIAHELAGNRIMAVSIYKKLHDLYPNTTEAHQALFQAGEVFMRAGDWLASKSEFKRLLPLVTDDLMTDAIHFRLGWIYLNLDEFEKALVEFRYVTTTENISYFRYMEAECLRRQGIQEPEKLNQAIMLFHNIASINLQSSLAPLAKLKAALTELQKGDSAGALVSLRQFLNLYPKDELVPAVYFLLGANESENASQRYFDQIVQQNRNSDVFDVAYFAMQNQDFRRGRYQRVITRNVSLPQLESGDDLNDWQRANRLLLAESAYFLKHYHQALQAFKQVSANMTDDLAQKANLGIAWCKLQTAGPDSALLMFEEIRRNVKGVNKVLANYGYATVQFLRQDYEKALAGYPIEVSHQKYPELQQVVLKSLFRSAQCYFRLQYYMPIILARRIRFTRFS
jgi:tetratricopeptide (TPR) repeat protein